MALNYTYFSLTGWDKPIHYIAVGSGFIPDRCAKF